MAVSDSTSRTKRRSSRTGRRLGGAMQELVEVVREYVQRLDAADPEAMRLRGEDLYAFEGRRERARAVLARLEARP